MTREPPCRQVVLLATCDDARVALTATIYTADIDMADHDRGVYETLALRVARHPSESDDYLVTRLLAYALEYTEGLEFSTGGLSSPDDPALAVRDLTGALRSWIEIGWPDPARLHKAAKASPRVAVYPHRDAGQWLKRLEGERIHRAADIHVRAIDLGLIGALAARLDRRLAFALAVSDGELFVSLGADTFTGVVRAHVLR
ncbi:YaeQ protein [Luteitalea pratensis]|uniref:YaeQ protein n=1 Tax=Luteitalea pratensis TaxID=1855912 RepID=A0A143PPF6_LUTPR|nr:YaeQ family protein [Luteitalea pratensis]AMY10008.1 YaeQ protein [Luteitalea pratensis]